MSGAFEGVSICVCMCMHVEVVFLCMCSRVCVCIIVFLCLCTLGQDQSTKSTLERVAQSSSPTHLSLSHLADAPLLSQFRES